MQSRDIVKNDVNVKKVVLEINDRLRPVERLNQYQKVRCYCITPGRCCINFVRQDEVRY